MSTVDLVRFTCDIVTCQESVLAERHIDPETKDTAKVMPEGWATVNKKEHMCPACNPFWEE